MKFLFRMPLCVCESICVTTFSKIKYSDIIKTVLPEK